MTDRKQKRRRVRKILRKLIVNVLRVKWLDVVRFYEERIHKDLFRAMAAALKELNICRESEALCIEGQAIIDELKKEEAA